MGISFQNCAPSKLTAAKIGNNFSKTLGTTNLASTATTNPQASAAGTYPANSPQVPVAQPTPTPLPTPEFTNPTPTPLPTPVFTNPTPAPAPAPSFGPGPSTPSTISFTPSEPQSSHPYTGAPLNNTGLSYNDAIALRKKILDSGKFPYIYTDASGGFSVIPIFPADATIWDPIQVIKGIPHDGDWSKIVGYQINHVAAALGYMPNDIYNACINSGLVVNSRSNGYIVGTALAQGCKTGTFIERGSTVKWSCNCSGDFSSWNGMGAPNCYQKLVQ